MIEGLKPYAEYKKSGLGWQYNCHPNMLVYDLARDNFPISPMGWQLNCHPIAWQASKEGSYLHPNPSAGTEMEKWRVGVFT